ncbi:amidohydrolase [Succinispira mobilis]|uniref:amidohydrolase n=1 Tax=Succinispira mobilis TaxID=78120 RepID=UPI00036E4E6D|nr:amidohydrolase [Succinispira mobilis]
MNTLIKNVELYENEQYVNRHITISDNIITAITPNLPSELDFDVVIDGSNKFATPGLVNTHTHAAMTLFRSYADDMFLMDWLENKIWPAEANLTAEDVYWGTLLSIGEMLKSGTTCFADMYFFMDEVAKAVETSGIRACLSRGLAGVAPNSDKSLLEAKEFCLKWNGAANGRITTMLGPHAPYTCPPDYLKQVIEVAKEIKAEIHIHLSETKFEVDTCIEKFGKTPIAHMDSLGLLDLGVLAAHCVHVTPEDIQLMKAKNVRVAHNPQSNLKLASGIAPVQQMLEAGLIVGLGTDGASSNNNLDLLEEVRLAALLHKVREDNPKVIPAQTALEMGTSCGAQALGLDKVGKLAVGYKADIVLYDMNKLTWAPKHDRNSLLVYSANSSDVHTVLVDGQVLVADGKLTTIDEAQVIAEVSKRGLDLVK